MLKDIQINTPTAIYRINLLEICICRLLIVNVKLCNVLPNKTIAVGILVFQDGVLKGFKARKVYIGEKSKMMF